MPAEQQPDRFWHYRRHKTLDFFPQGKLRWWLLGLIVLGWAVEQYEALKNGPVLVYILEDFDKTLVEWGYVAAAVGLVYSIGAMLLSRAADVVLKERRRLVLMVRETPLHAGHLESMLRVTNMGAIVNPPVPAFYTHPKSIEDMVSQTVGRVLDLFDLTTDRVKRWAGNQPRQQDRKLVK